MWYYCQFISISFSYTVFDLAIVVVLWYWTLLRSRKSELKVGKDMDAFMNADTMSDKLAN